MEEKSADPASKLSDDRHVGTAHRYPASIIARSRALGENFPLAFRLGRFGFAGGYAAIVARWPGGVKAGPCHVFAAESVVLKNSRLCGVKSGGH